MKTVALRFYNVQNLGDDLLVKVLSERYINEFRVLTPASYRFSTMLPNNVVSISDQGGSRRQNTTRLGRFLGRFEGSVDLNELALANGSDLFVNLGGSIFPEGPYPYQPYWRAQEAFYRELDVPYYVLGANVGPYDHRGFLRILRGIFSGAADVCFRDSPSFALFSDLPTVRLATDAVLSLDGNLYPRSNAGSAVLSVIDASRFDSATRIRYEQWVVGLTQELLSQGYGVSYMSFCEAQGDGLAVDRICAALPRKCRDSVETYAYQGNLEEALHLLAASELIVATRFHAVVLGLLFEKPVLPVVYDGKTAAFLQDLQFKGPHFEVKSLPHSLPRGYRFDSVSAVDVGPLAQLAATQFSSLDEVLTRAG